MRLANFTEYAYIIRSFEAGIVDAIAMTPHTSKSINLS